MACRNSITRHLQTTTSSPRCLREYNLSPDRIDFIDFPIDVYFEKCYYKV